MQTEWAPHHCSLVLVLLQKFRIKAASCRPNGIIGQPSAGRLNSSGFTIDGGLWSIVAAIQEPGAPLLSVRFTETNTVVVSWSMSWPGFVLLENPDLNTTNWTQVTAQPVAMVTSRTTSEKLVIVSASIGKRFYPLRKQ
jgi:hypothetical protein